MKYTLGITIFNDNNENCYATLITFLQSCTLPLNQVQINMVWCDETLEIPSFPDITYDEALYTQERQEELGEAYVNYDETYVVDYENETPTLEQLVKLALSNGVRFYYLNQEKNVVRKIIEETDAAYIHITKSGILYNRNMFKKLRATLDGKKVKACTVRIVAAKMRPTIEERKAYVTKVKSGGYLDFNKNTYHLIHYDFVAYFINKSEFSQTILDNTTDDYYWALNVAKVYFMILTNQPVINPINDSVKEVQNARDAFDWQLLKKEDEMQDFMEKFLKPIATYTNVSKPLCQNNAQYNIIYYVKQISLFHPDEEENAQLITQIREYVDELIDSMENNELVLYNRYLDRLQKHFFLHSSDTWVNDTIIDDEIVNEEIASIVDDAKQDNTAFFIEISEDKLILEGRCATTSSEAFDIFLVVNDEEIACEVMPYSKDKEWFDLRIALTEFYRCELPLEKGKEYSIGLVCKRGDEYINKDSFTFSKYMPLRNNLQMYYAKDGWILYSDEEQSKIYISPDTAKCRKEREKAMKQSFKANGKAGKKALIARRMFKLLKAVNHKRVWLVSDRTNRGDDNGECFFRYINENPIKGVKPYFVIDKNCDDYKRMKKYGKVIPVFSWRHKMYHLLSEYEISSQANDAVINPFKKFSAYYQDIMADRKLAFLQHGVIKDDLSDWLNKYNRNLYGFVTTTKAEYNSILDYDYYYEPKSVWLTGLPRHDYLYNDEKKYVTIMPTWRKTLTAGTNSKGEWILGEDFKLSSFFKFYNELLNDERLIKAAKDRGYTICFFPHPNVKPAIDMFEHNPDVIFFDFDKPYREVYAQSNVIMTDYSSAVFDFAYLRKPIVYCQFDRDEFFSGGHSYVEGYYNYQTDGFGEVEDNLDSLVDRLIEYMDNDCKLKDEYRKRIDEAFAYADKDCCKRVVQKLENRHHYFPDEKGSVK